jgi:hypothetical protein
VYKKFYPFNAGKDKRILIESGMRLWVIGDVIKKDRWMRDNRSRLPQDEFGGQVAGTRDEKSGKCNFEF